MWRHCSILSLFSLFQLLTPTLAAGPIARPASLELPSIINGANLTGIPERTQIRVYQSSVTVLISDYTPHVFIEEVRFLRVMFTAHDSIIRSMAAAPTDPIIRTPNQVWGVRAPYITTNSRNLEMTWEMLAHALMGVQDFYDRYAPMACTAAVIDDDLGYVGEVVVHAGHVSGPTI